MINYSVTMMANPMKPEEAKKAYARAQVTEIYDFAHFAKYVADHNSKYDEEDVMAVLIAVARRIRECLLNGRKVRLGHLGDIWLTLSSTGAESKDAFTVDNIKVVKALFTPGDYLQGLRKEAQFHLTTSRRAQDATLEAETDGKTFADWSPEEEEEWDGRSRSSHLLPDA